MPRFTIMDKMNVLSYISYGISLENISKFYGITVETINSIQQNRQAIETVFEYCLKCQNLPLKSGLYPHMENVLFCWFVEQTKVTNKALSEKAKEIIGILNESPTSGSATKFAGSTGWVNGFKGRYGIPVYQRKSKVLSTNNRDDINFFVTADYNTTTETEEPEEFEAEPDEFEAKLDQFEADPEELQVQYTTTLDDLDIKTEDDENVSGNGSNEDTLFAHGDLNGDHHTQAESGGIQNCPLEGYFIDAQDMDNDAEQMNRVRKITTTTVVTNLDLDNGDSDIPAVIDLTDEISSSKEDDIDATSNDEELTGLFKSKKRKRPTLITDDNSFSEDFSDSESSNANKRKKRVSSEVLVPTRKNGIKSMNLQDYKEHRVIRIFEPVLKYAKDMGWSDKDSDALKKLYKKSLQSCGGRAKQSTITEFFRKKK